MTIQGITNSKQLRTLCIHHGITEHRNTMTTSATDSYLIKSLFSTHADKDIIIIIIIGSTALGGPWPPQANVASNLYPRQPQPISTTQFPCVFLCPTVHDHPLYLCCPDSVW
jgi:hypothetical protein